MLTWGPKPTCSPAGLLQEDKMSNRFPRSLRTLGYLGAIVLHWAWNFKCYANSFSYIQHVIHLQSKQSFTGIMTELKIGQW